MLKRKKIAKLRRARKAALLLSQEKSPKEVNQKKREQAEWQKKLKEWRKLDHLRKYREAFGDCKVHEPRKTWAEGPTTKPRSVLEDY